MISQKILNWLNYKKKEHFLSIKFVKLNKIIKWKFNDLEIYHLSKRFFKIIGVKVSSNYYKNSWDQPIIVQDEIGILGIIKNPHNKKYLLQAKVEPGNINKLQLAPTVQATKSNYSSVHGGNKVSYIELFLKLKNINKYKQSEQGFRYLNKFNNNILINSKKNIKCKKDFYWFSKNEIKKLLYKKNIINMDTLSVFSSVLKKKKKDVPFNNNKFFYDWLKDLDKKFYIKVKLVKLIKLKDWVVSKNKIFHKNNKHFSVIGIDVTTNKREVNNWSQPIIKGKDMAFAGFIKSKINGTDHYLCRYILKPGLKKSVIGCTINTSDISDYNKDQTLNKIESEYYKNYFIKKKNKTNIIFNNTLSDEGGRFYQCQVRCMIAYVNFKRIGSIPSNYIWLSYNQIVEMIKNKRVDIESRLLFACGNIDHIS